MRTFTIRRDVDFIALAPILLGFRPVNSIVMLTVADFHARVDIPSGDDVAETVSMILGPARDKGVEKVALLIFDGDDHEVLTRTLVGTADEYGIEIVVMLEVQDDKFRHAGREWKEFDIRSHPFTLDAQFSDNRALNQTRDDVQAAIQPTGNGWDDETAEAVRQLVELGVHHTLLQLTRQNASEWVQRWTKALVGSEVGSDEAQLCALVLAYASWVSGDGAKAWIALDLTDPTTKWWRALAALLLEAVNPERWPDFTGEWD